MNLSKDIPLSDKDLRAICNEISERANVTDENKLSTITDLFKDRGHAIVFTHNKDQDVGHWTVFLRKPNNTIYFFDSYGRSPTEFPLINNFLKTIPAEIEIFYNPKQFQSLTSNVCGKYCLILIGLNKLGLVSLISK